MEGMAASSMEAELLPRERIVAEEAPLEGSCAVSLEKDDQRVAKQEEGEGEEEEDSQSAPNVTHNIQKWEEYYDSLRKSLTGAEGYSRKIEHYTMGSDGNIYRWKKLKDGTEVKRLVVRNYEERLKIVWSVHLNTGKETVHYRRDKMLEILGRHYFWWGQRRDCCECIAMCDFCSTRYLKRKPPCQSRDVRPIKKLPKLSASMSSIPGISLSPPSHIFATSSAAISESPLSTKTDAFVSPQASTYTVTVSAPDKLLNSQADNSFLLTHSQESASPKEPTSESAASSSSALPNSFQQIFSTIEAPPTSLSLTSTPLLLPASSLYLKEPTSPPPPPSAPIVPVNSSSSIYQMLFKIASEPDDSMFDAVVDSMHLAMKQRADHSLLTEAANSYLVQTLGLPEGMVTHVAPSRAAAYVSVVAASMLRIDPLSVSHKTSSQRCCPMAVVHDACCSSEPLKACSSLVGAYNWNLGSPNSPMDKQTLSSAITSNRVAAVFHQPYAYPLGCVHMSIPVIASICHNRDLETSVIVDTSGLVVQRFIVTQFVNLIKELCAKGADIVLLPETRLFKGPAHTCLVIGKASVLSEGVRNLSLLQSSLALPLHCPSYDLIGTVVAYKAMHVSTRKPPA